MTATESCENTKLVGYDPTGESAVLCNEAGEYCPQCEMVLCPSCHAEVASHLQQRRKPPSSVTSEGEREIRNLR